MARAAQRDPLAAVPHVAPGVEAKQDRAGRFQVRRELPDRPGWREWLARHFGLRRAVRIDLDERGSRFWNLIDGRRSLAEMVECIKRDLGADDAESRKAVVLFTKALMLRHLIALEMPGEAAEPKGPGDRG
jgi:hypothetical protein